MMTTTIMTVIKIILEIKFKFLVLDFLSHLPRMTFFKQLGPLVFVPV